MKRKKKCPCHHAFAPWLLDDAAAAHRKARGVLKAGDWGAVVGLGRHKRFPLTQNPLTGVGFLSRASHGSVVMLAVVFSSLARPEWTFQARGSQSSAIRGKKCNNSKTSCLKSFCLNTSRSLPLFFS